MIWNNDLYFNEDEDAELPQIFNSPYLENIERYRSFPRVPVCEHPIAVSNGHLVPCGHCLLCQARKKKEWINRNVCESKLHHQSCFLTLTFDDNHLENAVYPTVQKFLKRLRKIYGPFRYFGCFEKGERSGRPHFHMLIYGILPYIVKYKGCRKRTINECLATIWQQGFVRMDALNEKIIAYVCGYVQKKRDKNEYKPHQLSWREHTRASKYSYFYRYKDTYFFMSKGIGFNYFLPKIKSFVLKGFYALNGYKKYFGKWLRDKLKRSKDFLSQSLVWLLNGRDEEAESCDFLPSYVMEFAEKHPELIGPDDDELDIYYKYFDYFMSLNLQKKSFLCRINV